MKKSTTFWGINFAPIFCASGANAGMKTEKDILN